MHLVTVWFSQTTLPRCRRFVLTLLTDDGLIILNLPRTAERFSEESANPENIECQYKNQTTTIKNLGPLHLPSATADKELEGICCYGI
jgi:hypothetical protein